MRKTKINKQNNLDPYEDFVRLEKLDAYEAQIKCTSKNNTSIK